MKRRRWEIKLNPSDHPNSHCKLRFGYHFMGLDPFIHAYIFTYIYIYIYACGCFSVCVCNHNLNLLYLRIKMTIQLKFVHFDLFIWLRL